MGVWVCVSWSTWPVVASLAVAVELVAVVGLPNVAVGRGVPRVAISSILFRDEWEVGVGRRVADGTIQKAATM